MYNKIDLVVFQEGEEGELKSENVWTKDIGLFREALGPLACAFSENLQVFQKSDFYPSWDIWTQDFWFETQRSDQTTHLKMSSILAIDEFQVYLYHPHKTKHKDMKFYK